MKRRIIIICFLTSLAAFSQEKRLALVIGNSEYEHGGALKNPVNDAVAMKQALTQVGFEVIEHLNLDYRDMKRAIDDFGMKLTSYDIGLFFYAGHGVQAKANNYLIPVDANLLSENDVEYDCIDAGRILSKMEDAENRTNIIILDACRNNPFERSWTRSSHGKGLASMDAPLGSLLAYATAPGSTASDGTGQNGLYTSALIEFIVQPGLSIEDVFKRVRSQVVDKSNGTQTPWESTSLMGEFYFTGDIQSFQYSPQIVKAEGSNRFETDSMGVFLDGRDSNVYEWIRIGDQIWMAENLNHPTSSGSWCYNDTSINCAFYGRLYDWQTALSVCPKGWHLPGDTEWTILTNTLGGLSVAGNKLKEAGQTHWYRQNTFTNNSSGFTALPGGFRNTSGLFQEVGILGYWWSSHEIGPIFAGSRYLDYNSTGVGRSSRRKSYGFSVRCIKYP